MSANSAIEWTDSTFNPWWGCAKVSAGCANCYAEGVAGRFATGNLWGPHAERKPASEKVWNDPLRWDKAAAKAGRPAIVFCASMADVFEVGTGLDQYRSRLWDVIRSTPNLRWLLLTKRPENFHLMPPEVAAMVGLGVSVENQEAADRRIPLLLKTPAAMRFVSCEPLLAAMQLDGDRCFIPQRCCSGHMCGCMGLPIAPPPYIDWVICGGESGRNARPMHRDWARILRDQCEAAGVPFLFKQWGEYKPNWLMETIGGDEIPGSMWMDRVGKHAAGRALDGREHLEFPAWLREARP